MSRDAFLFNGREVLSGGNLIYHTGYPAHEDYYAFISSDLEMVPDVEDIVDVLVRRAYTIFTSYNNHGMLVVARLNYLINSLQPGLFVETLKLHRLLLLAYIDLVAHSSNLNSLGYLFTLSEHPAEIEELDENQIYLNIYRAPAILDQSQVDKYNLVLDNITDPDLLDLMDYLKISVNNYVSTTCGELKVRDIVRVMKTIQVTIDSSIRSRDTLYSAIISSKDNNPYYKDISTLAKTITELSALVSKTEDQILGAANDTIQNTDKITDLGKISPQSPDSDLIIVPGVLGDSNSASKVADNIFTITDGIINDQIEVDDIIRRMPDVDDPNVVLTPEELANVADEVLIVEESLKSSGGNLSVIEDAIRDASRIKASLDGIYDYTPLILASADTMEMNYVIYIDKILGLQHTLNGLAAIINPLAQSFADIVNLITKAVGVILCIIKALVCAITAALDFISSTKGKVSAIKERGEKYRDLANKSLFEEGEEKWTESLANSIKSKLSSKENIAEAIDQVSTIISIEPASELQSVLTLVTNEHWASVTPQSIQLYADGVVTSQVDSLVDQVTDYVKGVYGMLTDTSTCGSFNGWSMPRINISIGWEGLENPFKMPHFNNPLVVPVC